MSKQMSYVVAVSNAIDGNLTDETIERLEALKASLEKRAAHKSDKPTKAQSAAIALAETLFEAMEPTVVYDWKSAAELLPADEEKPYTAQRITALMKRLVADGRVVKATEKGKAVYSLAE